MITQVDDGEPSGQVEGTGRTATSSASMPAVVGEMLAALKVREGMRVLEIGTGTGYNATPWANPYYPGGLLSLTVGQDGTATGRIVGRTWFMELRDQRIPRCSVADVVRGDYQGERSTTTIEPYELAGHRGAMLAIGLRVPRCLHRYFPYDADDGAGELWFLDPWSGSWASHFHFTPGCSDEEFSVCQRGPRWLWDEVQAAHAWWVEHGRPSEHDWLFTVTPNGQAAELQ